MDLLMQCQQKRQSSLPSNLHGPGRGIVMNGTPTAGSYKEVASLYLLSVRIIQAKNIRQSDLVSKPDCYVSLWLPTASFEKKRTKTIWNSREPAWDETFHFRIQNQVKNILELSMHDADLSTPDDHLFTVIFDVAQLKPQHNTRKTFALNPKGEEELEVEFKMTQIFDPPEKIITNGVLVSREISCLEVQLDKQKNAKSVKGKKDLMLMVKGSYENSKSTTSSSGNQFLFHSVKGWEPELTACLQDAGFPLDVSFREDVVDTATHSLTVPLKSLPKEEYMEVAVPIEDTEQLNLKLRAKDCPEPFDVRLGFNLCKEERDFLWQRKRVVAAALKKVLQLDQDLKDHEVPVVAIMATGGGARAMTCLYSHLAGLQKLNLLDCVTYITGASGSTWTMSKLYEDADWSQKDLRGPVNSIKKQVTESKVSSFSWDRLKYYRKELKQIREEGRQTSFSDLWGLLIESMFYKEKNESKLSDQQRAVNRGQNPLPIYLAINVKEDDSSTQDFKEWCEFSPYEVGLLKYGVFVRTEDFGSEFFMGRLMKKIPESRICYLQGLWGNVFSLNLVDTWNLATNSEQFWEQWVKNRVQDIDKESEQLRERSSHLNTHLYTPSGKLSKTLKDILTNRPIHGEQHNFLKGFQLHNDYNQHNQFSTWKDSQLDSSPNQLTPLAEKLCLVDAGYFINASYPPLLRAERNVDIILSFDYTMDTPVQSIEQTFHYCSEQRIPFPKIELSEEERKNPKECYVFMDEKCPAAPTVLHFPLVNDTFRTHKAPGVKRSSSEMAEGDVNVSGFWSPYFLMNFTYSEHEFDRLLKLTEYNIQNNKDLILNAFRTAITQKKGSRT
ncbi:cytosolic phospholipase A2 delta-like [Rhinatrema bivittatum]|uniref:cytosolic phospholipase A2 delta-like n=1 Tax=Rhinatrema bivittatum TaxID=194408 RepID=UPI00112D7153|nr:cytosolic phospholipase A2 delta-like [Rhinatrema bivittatum]